MNTINDFHNRAMDIADNAFLLRRSGDIEGAMRLFLEAKFLEEKAAVLLPIDPNNEPSRSILFNSAASLAFNGKDYESTQRLAANGLSGYPPIEIEEELRDLIDEVTFTKHLLTNGIVLAENDVKMTLVGASVKKGVAKFDQIMIRSEKFVTLIKRTIDRIRNIPFSNSRKTNSVIDNQFPVFITGMPPSSFSIIFKVGFPEKQLSFFSDEIDSTKIIDEVLQCFELVEEERIDELKTRIPDQNYYDNFMGLTKQIAPDGNEVKTVGFTIIREGELKPVSIRKSRQEIKDNQSAIDSKQKIEENETFVLLGILRYANALANSKFGKVKLIEDKTNITHSISVPSGIIKDVVQPYFEEHVSITVNKHGKTLYLEDIK